MPREKIIKFFRGNKANLPTLGDGEPGFCKDAGELYIGTAGGNKRLTVIRKPVTVPSSAWTQASPSTATVAVPGITGTMTALDFDVEGASADQAHIEASAGLGNTDVTPGNGTITLTAIGVVPTVDLSLIVTIY